MIQACHERTYKKAMQGEEGGVRKVRKMTSKHHRYGRRKEGLGGAWAEV